MPNEDIPTFNAGSAPQPPESVPTEPIHPREFLAEYVEPAVELSRVNRLIKHLAVHAISEMDNLAEVTAIFTKLDGRPTLPPQEARAFRADLKTHEAVLGIIHDAHDSHKHGRLIRADKAPNPKGASQGQRPEVANRAGFFVGHSFVGRPPTRYHVLVVRLNDGTEQEVFEMLWRARQAWDREFSRLGL